MLKMYFNCICVAVLAIILLQEGTVAANLTIVMQKQLPAYTVASYSTILQNSNQCQSELEWLRQSIDDEKLWSLKMLDASGQPKPGFLYGNNFWLGYKSQCNDATNRDPLQIVPSWQQNNSLYRNFDEEFPPFDVNYFVARFRHNSTVQYHFKMPNEDMISLGLCLPASCTENDLSVILEKIFQDRLLMINELYSADFSMLEVTDLRDDYRWLLNWNIVVIGIIFVVIVLLVVSGSAYDIFIHHRREQNRQYQRETNKLHRPTQDLSNVPVTKSPSIVVKILLCFSVVKNTKKVLDTKPGSDTIEMMNGVRFIGMVLILGLHTGYFNLNYVDNDMWIWRLFATWYISILKHQGLFVVDTFFFFGGFLVAWPHFKNRQKYKEQHGSVINAKWSSFFDQFFKRIIRLTPTYIAVVCVIVFILTWISKTSQFVMYENSYEYCANYWWRNILYINNFFDVRQSCMSWSWYLPNDMQFYVITQFLLILSDAYFYTAATILCSLLIISIILSGYFAYAANFLFTIDDFWVNANIIYTPPWMRIGPYLIGVITAYIYVQMKGKLNVSKKIAGLLWIFGGVCALAALFGNIYPTNPPINTAVFIAYCHVAWGLAMAWFFIACQTGHAGIINRFLSWKVFNPLGKLTYCAYLLNPVIISAVGLISESPVHIDIFIFMTMCLGYTMLTYGFSYILTITVEMPFISVYRVLKTYHEDSKKPQVSYY